MASNTTVLEKEEIENTPTLIPLKRLFENFKSQGKLIYNSDPKLGAMCVLDRQLAKYLEVDHFTKDDTTDKPSGFQRKHTRSRNDIIARDSNKGAFLPPIVVANVDGKLLVVDGQHRLRAIEFNEFQHTVWVNIVEMNYEQAKKSFIEINTKNKKVDLNHILEVDAHPTTKKIRRIASALGVDSDNTVSKRQVMYCLMGITNSSSYPHLIEGTIDPKDFELVEMFLREWVKDDRWHNPTRSIFSHNSVLKLVCKFCKRYEDFSNEKPIDWINRFKEAQFGKFDIFNKAGILAKLAGVSQGNQMQMRDFLLEKVFKRTLWRQEIEEKQEARSKQKLKLAD